MDRRSLLLHATATASVTPHLNLIGAGVASSAYLAGASSAHAATTTALIPRAVIAGGDLSISRVIKGCWQLSGGHRGDSDTDHTSGSVAINDFQDFYRAGITSWDCADHYGPAEELIGRYLKDHPSEAQNVQVLTKLCVFSGAEMSTLNKGYISRAVDLSRSRLGVPSIDVMQFYWGDYNQPKYTDAMLYLAETQAEGRVKHLGVTNFDVPRMQRIVDKGVSLSTNQLSYSLLDTRPENGCSDFCQANGINMICYGVLAGGFLSEKYLGVPLNQVKIDTSSKGKYGRVIVERGGWSWFQGLLKVLDQVAKKHQSSISNVASKWVLDKPGVAGIILGARNADHVKDHVALFELALDMEDRGKIHEILSTGNRPRGDSYSWERGVGPF
ncbi:hypothetical protein CEUSTIGMA_g1779.t1 [Chlamydomonas eustigma]|uniref:NADP-dependent oxidoreductase domain-containing protein n=1 Tax=Chlamydomonas eustigma TaxID=1157962 RepID=A0A250WUV7_9CHLO|nr:hypothetical protein CEUSTIGMA_g1779.t1 [Chlamydomonas eustigma]|eukprot:GAX74330.1 hypothetical protein CEUSTIGMA_g1779.t1 [Chlamydomonas eustigma]